MSGSAASRTAFAVSGRVTSQAGTPLQGASVTVNPVSLGGSAPQTVVTDANGNFSVAGLINSTYEITPSLAGFTFTPPSTVVTIKDQNVIGLDFTALQGGVTTTPFSYTIQETLDSLKMAVGAKPSTPAGLARFDIAPLLNGVAQPDGKINLQDVIVILRLAVGLPM